MKYSDVKISLERWYEVFSAVRLHEGDNPACKLGRYWKDRMSPKMKKALEEDTCLPYGFVGDGWPQKFDQTWALEYDKYGLRYAYDLEDWHCRDVGDAIYQATTILDFLSDRRKRETVVIWDVGAGYGRLTVPFYFHLSHLEYHAFDFSPIGLLTAPQFVDQMTKMNCFWYDMKIENQKQYKVQYWTKGFFASCLPISNIKYYGSWDEPIIDVAISVHSFQEMELDTIRWYIDLIGKAAKAGTCFYSVNLDTIAESPEGVTWLDLIPESWELVFDRPYPINRDGSFNERMWKIC